MTDQHVPIRTCIGCRARATRGELLRYVLVHGSGAPARVVRDESRSGHGRGAWIHDQQHCLQQAIKRRTFRRALRIAGDIEVGLPDHDGTDGNDGAGHVTSPILHTEEAVRRR